MARLTPDVHGEVDALLRPIDGLREANYPGDAVGRQPVHTVYVPADRFTPDTVREWGTAALAAVREHGPPPCSPATLDAVVAKLTREPIEDLRIDFEDGYGIREDAVEDAAAVAAATVLREDAPAFCGLRVKSLEPRTRQRAIRTLDVFLEALGRPPDGFVVTLPKVTYGAQVAAMMMLCERLEEAHRLPAGSLRFELQVETPQAVLGADGTATVAKMIHLARGRCTGLHYGTYDYSAALGVAAAYQSLDHPVADHAKAVMQVAAAGTGVRLSDGSTNVLPVGDTPAVRSAWQSHARLVRRCLERGFYQGWDLHPAQLPTRFAATYEFFRDGLPAARDRLTAYLRGRSEGVLDEPATARALAGFLLRAVHCGAVDVEETGFALAELETAR